MLAPNYSADDFKVALQALLPRGLAWPRDRDALQSQVIAGLSVTLARHTTRANNLLIDSFPASSYELLPEWETTLGLPDPAIGTATTLQGRRAQVVAHLAGVGGQSISYITHFAANLGYYIRVTESAPFRCGQSRCGHALGGSEWHHTWAVNAKLNTITAFRAGASVSGEPLACWGNTQMQSAIRKIAPAHTWLIFQYT